MGKKMEASSAELDTAERKETLRGGSSWTMADCLLLLQQRGAALEAFNSVKPDFYSPKSGVDKQFHVIHTELFHALQDGFVGINSTNRCFGTRSCPQFRGQHVRC